MTAPLTLAPEYAYKFDLDERPYKNLSRENLTSLYDKYYTSGETHKAIGFLMEFLHRAPYDELYKKEALFCIYRTIANQFNPLLKQIVLSALTGKTSTKDRAFILWQDLLHLDPVHAPLHSVIEHVEEHQDPPQIDLKALRSSLDDSFLHAGLSSFILSHSPTEQALTHIRKYILLHPDKIQDADLDFLSAMAIHNFYAEFTFYEDEKETSKIDHLIEDLRKNRNNAPLKLALLGCYRPLFKYISLDIVPVSQNYFYNEMIKTHITEPLIEQKIKPTIENISEIKDDVSQSVQNMYEENPYPRWFDQNPLPRIFPDIKADILIAGCGTGNFTTQLALLFPNSKIKAVDLSRSSISYAIRKARGYGAFNVDFKQGDILELKNIGQEFDLIECSGVLHHMKDPEAGWDSLIHCLKPGGRMFIALYSEIAREPVVRCRELIAQMGYKTDAASIRKFRHELMQMDKDNILFSVTFFQDFFTLSECRDLLFHIQEKRFTLPELKDTMDRLGLSFLGFRRLPKKTRKAYARLYPDDKEQMDLLRWHEVEKENTDLFISMYQFVCCRKGEEDIVNEQFNKIMDTGYFPTRPDEAQDNE